VKHSELQYITYQQISKEHCTLLHNTPHITILYTQQYNTSQHNTSQYNTAHSTYFFLLIQAIVYDEVVHASLLVIVIVPPIGAGWDGA
jgi:hypothetical protein